MIATTSRYIPLSPEATLAIAGGTVTVPLNPTTTVEIEEARP